jgi:hypothetical protein
MLPHLQIWQLAQPQMQLTQHRWPLLIVLQPEMLERVRLISLHKMIFLGSYHTFFDHTLTMHRGQESWKERQSEGSQGCCGLRGCW